MAALITATTSSDRCSFCEKPAEQLLSGLNKSMQRCARCGIVQYCSKDCQKNHWKAAHKQVCIAPSADSTTAATHSVAKQSGVLPHSATGACAVDETDHKEMSPFQQMAVYCDSLKPSWQSASEACANAQLKLAVQTESFMDTTLLVGENQGKLIKDAQVIVLGAFCSHEVMLYSESQAYVTIVDPLFELLQVTPVELLKKLRGASYSYANQRPALTVVLKRFEEAELARLQHMVEPIQPDNLSQLPQDKQADMVMFKTVSTVTDPQIFPSLLCKIQGTLKPGGIFILRHDFVPTAEAAHALIQDEGRWAFPSQDMLRNAVCELGFTCLGVSVPTGAFESPIFVFRKGSEVAN